MLDDVLPAEARDEVTALQTKETGGPADDRRTGAQTETRTDREVDGQTEAQVADHVS